MADLTHKPESTITTTISPASLNPMDYQVKVWTSGKQGGGFVPPEFGWPTNPKQYQEEFGSAALSKASETVRQTAAEKTQGTP